MSASPRPWKRGEFGAIIRDAAPRLKPQGHPGLCACSECEDASEDRGYGGPVVAESVADDDAELILRAVEHLDRQGELEAVALELYDLISRRILPGLAVEARLARALGITAMAARAAAAAKAAAR